MPDVLISAHSTLRPLFHSLPLSGQTLAKSIYRRLLQLRYGQLRLAESWQNGRLWKLHPEVALRGQEAEIETIEWFRKVILTGMDVLDIGANVGQMTLEMAYLVGSQGRVIAVEPGPGNVRLLKAHVEGNEFADRVSIVAAACADRDKQTIDLKIFGEDVEVVGSGFSIVDVPQTKTEEKLQVHWIQVPTTTIDALCAEFSLAPQVIKIDVEGAELLVLKGAHDTLAKSRPIIHFSFHPFAFPNPEEVSWEICSLFANYEYTIQNVDGAGVEESLGLSEYVASPL